jgi:integrase
MAGRTALPATQETLGLFLTSLIESGRRVSTAEHRAWAISSVHRASGHASPVGEDIRKLLSGARRTLREVPRRKAALRVEHLRLISAILKRDGTAVSCRNRAILVLGFASGLRRSELSALDLCDVEFVPEKGASIRLRRSKTGQECAGRQIGIFCGQHPDTCPVAALREWVNLRGGRPGPLFTRFDQNHCQTYKRLCPDTIADVVKAAVRRIGLDPNAYSGHSLRAGCVTAAVEGGASELAIMERTGHRSVATVRRYVRHATVFAVDPLAGVL